MSKGLAIERLSTTSKSKVMDKSLRIATQVEQHDPLALPSSYFFLDFHMLHLVGVMHILPFCWEGMFK